MESLLDRYPGLVALQIVYEDFARDCDRCDRAWSRKSVVFGHGTSDHPLFMFVGAQPDAEDHHVRGAGGDPGRRLAGMRWRKRCSGGVGDRDGRSILGTGERKPDREFFLDFIVIGRGKEHA